MSFIAKNPISAAKIDTSPPSPYSGMRGLYPQTDGWYDIDDNGDTKKLAYEEEVEILKKQMEDILYEPISITSFTHNKQALERGVTVTDVTLSWKTNKVPTTLTLDGVTLGTSTTSKALTGLSITYDNNKTWTLAATDDRGASATKTTTLTFYNGIYYGVGDRTEAYDSSFILSLTKTLQGSRSKTFTVSPDNEFIYFCSPVRLGACSFKVGGFEGGFEAPTTISFTNASNYTEDYYIYKSTNKITDSVTVVVS